MVRLFFGIALISALVVGLLAEPSKAFGESNDNLKMAGEAVRRGSYDDAVFYYTEALKSPRLTTQERANALFHRGNMRIHQERLEDALDDYNQVIVLLPGDVMGYVGRGLVYEFQGKFKSAIDEFDRVIAVDLRHAPAYYNRGICYFALGLYGPAQADFEKVVALNPSRLYGALWLHITQSKLETADLDSLRIKTSGVNKNKWPGPLVKFYLGETTSEELDRMMGRGSEREVIGQRCETDFYLGELSLERRDLESARMRFNRAVRDCPKVFFESIGARVELARMEKR